MASKTAAQCAHFGRKCVLLPYKVLIDNLSSLFIMIIHTPEKAAYRIPVCRITEWAPERGILSDDDFYPFEDEDYSEGGEYIW